MSGALPRPPIVYVEWRDAKALSTRWNDRTEIVNRANEHYKAACQSAGFLLVDGKDFVVISLELNAENDDIGQAALIPRSEIVEMTVLRPARGWDKE